MKKLWKLVFQFVHHVERKEEIYVGISIKPESSGLVNICRDINLV